MYLKNHSRKYTLKKQHFTKQLEIFWKRIKIENMTTFLDALHLMKDKDKTDNKETFKEKQQQRNSVEKRKCITKYIDNTFSI